MNVLDLAKGLLQGSGLPQGVMPNGVPQQLDLCVDQLNGVGQVVVGVDLQAENSDEGANNGRAVAHWNVPILGTMWKRLCHSYGIKILWI